VKPSPDSSVGNAGPAPHIEESGDYSAGVIDHFMSPRNAGILQDAELEGAAGTPGQGPHVVMYVKLLREADAGDRAIIADIRFRTWGCPAAIASCSKLTEMVKGRSVEGALRVEWGEVLSALGGLPLGKHHCPKLAVTALRNALKHVTEPGL